MVIVPASFAKYGANLPCIVTDMKATQAQVLMTIKQYPLIVDK
jgi:hypothetical protein